MSTAEAELEQFRQKWKEEVSAKTKKPTGSSAGPSNVQRPIVSRTTAPPRTSLPPANVKQHEDDELLPLGYHDLDEKQTGRRLDEPTGGSSSRQPETALEHYEKAVEREGQGSLGDSLSLYRKAFRMDSNVDKKYKNKHFPPSAFKSKPQNPNPSNASVTVPNTAHHSLTALPPTLAELVNEFSELAIEGEPAPTDLSPAPPCPISKIPEEILAQIMLHAAFTDVAALSRLAQVCKRLAFLVMTEDSIWKKIVHGREFGFPAMHYKFACSLAGEANNILENSVNDVTVFQPQSSINLPLTPKYPTYRQMFRQRPRVRFNGCYISTVNYTRPGGTTTTSVTWNTPVLIVTYYRYLRFFRDGSLISLLTTSEPGDVVPYLQLEHLHQDHTGALPQRVIKDALRGRWRLSGNPWKSATLTEDEETEEPEGDLIVETDGVRPKYMYKMHLALGSAGKGTRNNKLTWRGYWSWNRLTDDWAAFELKHDRAFYWSRVRSFGTGS